MKSIFRNLLAGTAVAAASLLGTMDKAQAQSTFSFQVNATCQGTLSVDGVNYTAGTTTVEQFYNIDPTKAGQGYTGGTGYEIIRTPTETITTSLQPIAFNMATFGSGNASDASLLVVGRTAPYYMGFDMDVGGIALEPTAASFEAFCNAFNAKGAPYPGAVCAYTTANSPSFEITSMTPIVPEPSAVLLTNTVVAGGRFKFSFNSVLGHTHAVRYRADAHSGLWQTLTNIVGDGSFKSVQTPATNAACFFQVITQ